MIKIVPPVRFYTLQKVTDVIIVSPDKTPFSPVGRYYAEAGKRDEPFREASPEAGPKDEERAAVGGELDHGEVFLPNLRLGQEREERREASFPYAAASDFHLDPSPKEKTGFSLVLSLQKKEPERITGDKEPKKMDLFRFGSTWISPLRFKREDSRKTLRQNRDTQTVQAWPSPFSDFDISPWAKEVVDKIRNNWMVPPIEESRARGKVKIWVTIGKDGTLMGFEIVESSDFLLFDESAAQAVRSSAPFPPLPDDFPADRLETYLVFEFNE